MNNKTFVISGVDLYDGKDVEINISDEACAPFGVRCGEQVLYPYNNQITILCLGLLDLDESWMLWFSVEKNVDGDNVHFCSKSYHYYSTNKLGKDYFRHIVGVTTT